MNPNTWAVIRLAGDWGVIAQGLDQPSASRIALEHSHSGRVQVFFEGGVARLGIYSIEKQCWSYKSRFGLLNEDPKQALGMLLKMLRREGPYIGACVITTDAELPQWLALLAA